MPKLLLTDIVASTAKPVPGKQLSLWDTGTKGFGLRINPQGTKTWQVMIGHKRQRITIGHYPKMSLKQARKLAQTVIGNGEPPPKQSTDVTPYLASAAVAKFIELHHANSRPNWRYEQERLLKRHLLSKHADRPLDKFTAAHILAITDNLAHLPSEQFHAHRALKAFFKWAVHRHLIPVSPVANLAQPGKVNDRDRLLTDDELVRIYNAAVDLAYPFGFIVLICIHTGLRRGEVGALKWSYISPDFITIPKEIAKNGREHVIPNLINGNLALVPKTSEYLFPTSTGNPFCAWGKNKARLDKLCAVDDFVLHDFRRYLSSTMRRLGVPIDVTETILNHVSGSRSQIQRIYDRHDRLPEMREALQLYEKHLAALISSH
ncbi:MAG: tyrosine-type recombinase/integrase [Hyphomicrobiaceae bacterium]